MNERIKKLAEQASLLPPIERAELVEGILRSLDRSYQDLDRLWAEDLKDRLTAWRHGGPEARDFSETTARPAGRNPSVTRGIALGWRSGVRKPTRENAER